MTHSAGHGRPEADPRRGRYRGLPASDAVPHPPRLMLHSLRPLARTLVRRRFAVQVHGTDRVPARGPVILAANHIGIADGPLLAMFAPRRVHALTKREMFRGWLGRFLHRSGQIPIDRYRADPRAVKLCLRVLRGGGAIGIFPEGARGGGDLGRFHRGAAYLGMVSGAAVVPVTFFGSRAPGAGVDALPPRGGLVEIVLGTPYRFAPVDWPRTREQVEHASLLLREHMVGQLADATARTGRALPGPLPAGQSDDDPDTDVIEGAP